MPRAKKPRASCLNCDKEVRHVTGKFCSNKCQGDWFYQSFIVRWKAGLEKGIRGQDLAVSNHIRRYLMEKYHGRCAECGWHKRNPVTGKVPLTINHINGDCTNNREENLTLLCPNCHSLTPNYGALNKGSGRWRRRKNASATV
jgi:hypothetical protein